MIDLFESIGISAIITMIVFVAATRIAPEWLLARLTKGVEHELAKKLEKLKSDLSLEADSQLAAHRAGVSAQTLGAEKRIAAAETLWKAICAYKTRNLQPFFLMGWLTEEEYLNRITSPEFQNSYQNYDQGVEFLIFDKSLGIESLRPFLTQELWKLYFIYRAFSGRLIFLEEKCSMGDREYLWYNDTGVSQILSVVFSENEIAKLIPKTFKDPSRIKDALEGKMLKELKRIISGEVFGRESWEQALELGDIERKINAIQS